MQSILFIKRNTHRVNLPNSSWLMGVISRYEKNTPMHIHTHRCPLQYVLRHAHTHTHIHPYRHTGPPPTQTQAHTYIHTHSQQLHPSADAFPSSYHRYSFFFCLASVHNHISQDAGFCSPFSSLLPWLIRISLFFPKIFFKSIHFKTILAAFQSNKGKFSMIIASGRPESSVTNESKHKN